jgi:ABC-type multidrug transport system fused ATPase/permease subunit
MIFAEFRNAMQSAAKVLAAERGRLYFALFLCILGGAVELVGVSTLFPFLALLVNPKLIQTNNVLRFLFVHGGFQSTDRFLLWCGWLALVAFFVTILFQFLRTTYVTRFCVEQTSRVSVSMLDAYLRKSMLFHVDSNSGELSKDVIAQSDQFTTGVLPACMTIVGDGVILIVLVGLILSADVRVGLIILGILASLLGVVLALTRRRITVLAEEYDRANGGRFAFCIGALESIKEIKAAGREEYFGKLFGKHAEEFARAYTSLSIMQVLPLSVTQFVTAGAVIGIAVYYIAAGADLSRIVPTLVMYAVVGYRLMPSFSRLSGAVSVIRQLQPAVNNITAVLHESLLSPVNGGEPDGEKLAVVRPTIEFRNVGFTYPRTEHAVLDNLDLTIQDNSFVCLVGTSGSGKTTLVDLMLGLLSPDKGEILINGESIRQIGERRWRTMFGYVPQSLYIVDGTIAENIAFGIPEKDVDQERLRCVIRQCHLGEFINSQPDGVNSLVGDRGSRLSGGQRQRIGIARAMYRDPPILILDESTSALDGISEKYIIDTLHDLKRDRIIIAIAHGSSLVRNCDRVILIDQGKMVADGDYRTLYRTSPLFMSLMSEMRERGL